jgi:hypothetical protein
MNGLNQLMYEQSDDKKNGAVWLRAQQEMSHASAGYPTPKLNLMFLRGNSIPYNSPIPRDALRYASAIHLGNSSSILILEPVDGIDWYRVLFDGLAKHWKDRTRFSSVISKSVRHSAYRTIIGLGPRMVPFMIDDLKSENPPHWFSALVELTGSDPVSSTNAGNIRQMADDWICWWARRSNQ